LGNSRSGRHLKFRNAAELGQAVNSYFDECEKNKRPYLISGLAFHLSVTRQTLLNYAAREEFSQVIERAKARCEMYAEQQLFVNNNMRGAIFNLKNNYGWTTES
jgi:DNA-packaging protein gp3